MSSLEVSAAGQVEQNCKPSSGMRRLAGQLLPYLMLVCSSLILLILVLELWKADLRIPFDDRGDALWVNSWIKGIQDNGWYLHNPRLGAPGGSDLYDFPMSENLHLFVIKLLGLVFKSPGLLFNVYVLLMYPLTACTAFFVLRKLSLSMGLALVGALLYAFLPYHLFRGHPHIFLASYYLAPFQLLMALTIARGGSDASTEGGRISRPTIAGMFLVAFLVSAGGVYYAFFGCFFLMLAGLYAGIHWGGWRSFLLACLLCAWTSIFTVVNLLPSLLYHREHGFNVDAVRRMHFESEMFGLKVIQLLLPITHHRIAWLAEWKIKYRYRGLLINENDAASLGVIASIGFLWLLIQLLRRNRRQDGQRPGLTQSLAILNWGAILLATIGGFGSLFSFLATPWIRGYNRISVYIAFCSLAAVLLLIDSLLGRFRWQRRFNWLYIPALLGLLTLGIYDQSSPKMIPDYAALKAASNRRKEFLDRVEASLPRDAMIFQLPYVGYPESMGYCWSDGYDALRLYLQSKSLRWSFGAVRGREGDSFALMLSTLPAKAMLERAIQAGYQGLVIDRLAYKDLAGRLTTDIAEIVGYLPLDGDEHRWIFFPLDQYKRTLQRACSTEDWNRACEAATHPVVPLFGKGYDHTEGPADKLERWCLNQGEVFLCNPSPVAREVEIDMQADRPMGNANLRIRYEGGNQEFHLIQEARHFRFRYLAPPGKARMEFVCDAPPYIEVHADPRQIENIERAYRILNFQVSPVMAPVSRELARQHRPD